MAAKPLPIPEVPTIYIDEDGHVSEAVDIVDGGQVTFKVNKYRSGQNECKITISAGNVSWHHRDDLGGGTIKVGGGGGADGKTKA